MNRHTTSHMKRILCLLWLLVLTLPALAQDVPPESTPEASEPSFVGEAEVNVISAFVRAEPTTESEAVASVFERDTLEVVGRNIDGLWFLVRRPGRIFNLGWISHETLSLSFEPENLSLEDAQTGFEGGAAVVETGFAAFFLAEANLRDAPIPSGGIILEVPLNAILPIVGRDPFGSWFQVNYRGTLGWVSRAVIRRPDNEDAIPVVVVGDVPVIEVPIIPPEIQLAQLESLRTYAQASYDVADQLANLWAQVLNDEVMPCNPPPFVQEYLYTQGDVQQLPELDRYVPRFNEGLGYLNDSIATLSECGVMHPATVTAARNNAINARTILSATLDQLDSLERLIRDIQGE